MLCGDVFMCDDDGGVDLDADGGVPLDEGGVPLLCPRGGVCPWLFGCSLLRGLEDS